METRELTIICSIVCMAYPAVAMTFDAGNVSHEFLGFGAQIWPGDMRVGTIFTDLNMKYARMCPGGCSNPPTDATQAQMDAYVDSEYNGTTRGNIITASLQMAENIDIQMILNMFGGPAAWLDTGNRLKSENFDDFARLWASQVYFFKSCGLRINYIELANEPEGDWNIYIPGTDYNTVVKLVRQELDNRGLTDVGIVGPGLAYLYHGPTWISALDSDGKAALACWSTHAWDEGWGHTDALPSFLDQRWQDYFGAAVDSADPTHSKPVVVTEYATGVRTYNGVTYQDNEVGETSQFAQRCYENSLTLVNNGANVLCYWEAANQYWQDDPDQALYGLMRTDSSLRPVYFAFSTLAPYIPNDAMVISKTWDDPLISAAGFIGDNHLVLAFANSTASIVNRTVGITGITSFAATSALAFESGAVVNKLSQVNFDYDLSSMDITLAPESTLTIVATVNECTVKAMGDLNGDCYTKLDDYSIVAADWLEDNYVAELEVIEDFESYADDSWLQAAWVMNMSSDITGETLVNDPGVLNGSNCMLITSEQNVMWTQTKLALPGAVHNVHGVNLTYPGYTAISITFAIPPNDGQPPWGYIGGSGGDVFLSMYDCWGQKVFSASYPGDVTPSGTGWPNGIVWELDFATYTESGMNLENVEQITVGYNNGWYGNGGMFVDDIVVYNSSSLVCQGEPAGDVNQDCVVDFSDILVLSENWLRCVLVEGT